jgi:hypothetical protein
VQQAGFMGRTQVTFIQNGKRLWDFVKRWQRFKHCQRSAPQRNKMAILKNRKVFSIQHNIKVTVKNSNFPKNNLYFLYKTAIRHIELLKSRYFLPF